MEKKNLSFSYSASYSQQHSRHRSPLNKCWETRSVLHVLYPALELQRETITVQIHTKMIRAQWIKSNTTSVPGWSVALCGWLVSKDTSGCLFPKPKKNSASVTMRCSSLCWKEAKLPHSMLHPDHSDGALTGRQGQQVLTSDGKVLSDKLTFLSALIPTPRELLCG